MSLALLFDNNMMHVTLDPPNQQKLCHINWVETSMDAQIWVQNNLTCWSFKETHPIIITLLSPVDRFLAPLTPLLSFPSHCRCSVPCLSSVASWSSWTLSCEFVLSSWTKKSFETIAKEESYAGYMIPKLINLFS